MNKSEIIEQLSITKQIPKKKAEEAVNLVFDSMAQALVEDQRIEIRGFGSFVNRTYKAYQGRNPRTGTSIQVKPKRLPYFKVGKELKKRVDAKA